MAQVNGVAVKAFVDSGAQTSIMSQACAERCKILRLLDRRFSGVARGVGSGKILGRIHTVLCLVSLYPKAQYLTGLDSLAGTVENIFKLDMGDKKQHLHSNDDI